MKTKNKISWLVGSLNVVTWSITMLLSCTNVQPLHMDALGTSLHLAINSGDTAMVSLLLDNTPEAERFTLINQRDNDGMTALHNAIIGDQLEVVNDVFLGNQIPEAERMVLRGTALFFAVMHSKVQIVNTLFNQIPEAERATLINHRNDNSYGWTALHMASNSGHTAFVDLLLNQLLEAERVSLINQRNDNRETALHLATNSGETAVVNLLLNNTPEAERFTLINQRDDFGFTALQKSILRDQWEIVNDIFLGNQIPETDRIVLRGTALVFAALHNKVQIVNTLLNQIPEAERVALINQSDNDGRTALHIAINSGDTAMVSLLLNNTPEAERFTLINQRDNDGMTVLQAAIENDKSEILNVLLSGIPEREREALVSRQDIYVGGSLLHCAAQYGHGSVVKILLKHGANTEQRNNGGKTALNVAIQNSCQEAARVLLVNGASISEDMVQNITQTGFNVQFLLETVARSSQVSVSSFTANFIAEALITAHHNE